MKILTIIIVFCMLALNAFGSNHGLSEKQIRVLKDAYHFGEIQNDDKVGLLLAGLALQESSAGNNRVSKSSFGVFQINIKTAKKRFKNVKGLKKKLINNDEFSAKCAVHEVQYWTKFWKSKGYSGDDLESKIIASYNNGFMSDKNRHGKLYYNSVMKKIKIVKEVLDCGV